MGRFSHPADPRLTRFVAACEELDTVSKLWDAERHRLRDGIVTRGERALATARAEMAALSRRAS